MTYTVWQGDRMIGETDLSYEPARPRHRAGNFYPSAGSESLIPSADLSLQLRDSGGRTVPTDWISVYDLDAAAIPHDALDFVESEFDHDGRFPDIAFDDPELEAAVEADASLVRQWIEENAALDDPDDDAIGEEFSRYQIQLMLAADAPIS